MTLSLFYCIQRLLVETHTNFELVLLDTTTTRGDTYRAYIFIQPLFMETTTQFYLIQRCTSILVRCARRTATITSCCLHSSLQQKASGGTPQHSAAHSDDYILLFIVCLRLGKVTFFCFLQIRSLSPPSPPGQIEAVIRTIIIITISNIWGRRWCNSTRGVATRSVSELSTSPGCLT